MYPPLQSRRFFNRNMVLQLCSSPNLVFQPIYIRGLYWLLVSMCRLIRYNICHKSSFLNLCKKRIPMVHNVLIKFLWIRCSPVFRAKVVQKRGIHILCRSIFRWLRCIVQRHLWVMVCCLLVEILPLCLIYLKICRCRLLCIRLYRCHYICCNENRWILANIQANCRCRVLVQVLRHPRMRCTNIQPLYLWLGCIQ